MRTHYHCGIFDLTQVIATYNSIAWCTSFLIINFFKSKKQS